MSDEAGRDRRMKQIYWAMALFATLAAIMTTQEAWVATALCFVILAKLETR